MKKIAILTIAIISGFLLITSCNHVETSKPAFDLAEVRKAIDTANRNFSALVIKGDSVGLANMYTVDAKMMGPNEPAVIGRKNIQTAFAALVKMGSVKLVFKTLDVWGSEALVAEEGEDSMLTMDGKELDKGKYIVLWKKEDGKWKLFRDIYNADLPLPKAK